MDSDFVVGINKSIDAAKGETGQTYPAYLHNTLVTEKLDELAGAISEGGGGGGGTPQVQADWNETDTESKAYIKNKPTIPIAITGLDDIPDVDLTNPTDGQTIKYNATLGKWVNVDSSYRTIHSSLKVYRTMDSYETTISIYSDSDALLYKKVINVGNYRGDFDPITEHFDVSGVTNTITMYGDGVDDDRPQNWLHIILNDFQYDLGNTARNPSFPLDLSIDSAVKTGDSGSSITVIPGTLTAGNTTVTISDDAITTNSIIIPCVDEAFAGVAPTAQATAAGSVTLTFPVQSTDMLVKVVVI